jgi:hypothetical protein
VHKHQLCDKTDQCALGGDESGELCKKMTKAACKRRYVLGSSPEQLTPFPVAWINDGLKDCWSGEDEDEDWPTCGAGRTIRYWRGHDSCSEVFLCNHDEDFVQFSELCDRIDSCENENKICKVSRTQLNIFSIGLRDFDGSISLSYCLKGLENIGHLDENSCGHFKLDLPLNMNEVFGKNASLKIKLPMAKVKKKCNNLFGELYVFTSCLEYCLNSTCPLNTSRPLHFYSCPGQYTGNRVNTVDANGNLTFLIKDKKNNVLGNNIFQCSNSKCLTYDKVCNLVDDCGDASDEMMCSNHFQCEESREYLSIDQKCDNVIHCLDKSDECNTACGRQILNNMFLKVSAWIIGILAIVLNCKAVIKGGRSLNSCKTDAAFCNNCLVIFIALGDLLVGVYLTVLSSFDTHYRSEYCPIQFEWLTSNTCKGLGITCTLGSQISLFSMTALSLLRVMGIRNDLMVPKEISQRSYVKVALMFLVTLVVSLTISIYPVLDAFEDFFVNGLTYESYNTLLIGSLNKERLMKILEQYYGRMPNASVRWRHIKQLVNQMFSHDHGGIKHRTLTFYGNDPVCVFKYFVNLNDPQRNFVLFILVINLFCFILVAAAYVVIGAISRKSARRVKDSKNSSGTGGDYDSRLQRVTQAIIFTDFLCWVPFIVISFLHLSDAIDASSWYSFITILVLPINCIVNPILYDNYATRYIYEKFGNCIPDFRILRRLKNRRNQVEDVAFKQENGPPTNYQQFEMQPVQRFRKEQEKDEKKPQDTIQAQGSV